MLPALVTMVAAQLFDFGTFFVMVRRHGPTAEANPLVASILEDLGMPAVVLAKAALVLLVAAIALILASRASSVAAARPRLAGVVLGAAIVAGLIGGGTNALTIGPI